MINSHGIPSFVPIGNLANLREELAQIHDNSLSDAEMLISMIRAVNRMGLLVGEMADNWAVVETWIKTDGVSDAVAGLLNQWATDGTLAKILDKTSLNKINKRMDEFDQTLRDEISKMQGKLSETVNDVTAGNQAMWKNVIDMINNKLNGGAVSGIFDNLNTLKAKYPNGADGVFLTRDNNHIYFWDTANKQWIDAGAYEPNPLTDEDKQKIADYAFQVGEILDDVSFDNGTGSFHAMDSANTSLTKTTRNAVNAIHLKTTGNPNTYQGITTTSTNNNHKWSSVMPWLPARFKTNFVSAVDCRMNVTLHTKKGDNGELTSYAIKKFYAHAGYNYNIDALVPVLGTDVTWFSIDIASPDMIAQDFMITQPSLKAIYNNDTALDESNDVLALGNFKTGSYGQNVKPLGGTLSTSYSDGKTWIKFNGDGTSDFRGFNFIFNMADESLKTILYFGMVGKMLMLSHTNSESNEGIITPYIHYFNANGDMLSVTGITTQYHEDSATEVRFIVPGMAQYKGSNIVRIEVNLVIHGDNIPKNNYVLLRDVHFTAGKKKDNYSDNPANLISPLDSDNNDFNWGDYIKRVTSGNGIPTLWVNNDVSSTYWPNFTRYTNYKYDALKYYNSVFQADIRNDSGQDIILHVDYLDNNHEVISGAPNKQIVLSKETYTNGSFITTTVAVPKFNAMFVRIAFSAGAGQLNMFINKTSWVLKTRIGFNDVNQDPAIQGGSSNIKVLNVDQPLDTLFNTTNKDLTVQSHATLIDNSVTKDLYVEFSLQGGSSVNYGKKNLKMKLYSDSTFKEKTKEMLVQGAPKHKKFNLKANYIDATQTLNLTVADLAIQMSFNEGTEDPDKVNWAIDDVIKNSPTAGQVQGSPCILNSANRYMGLFTLNTGKDSPLFNMDDDNPKHFVLQGVDHTDATLFKTSVWGDSDFSVEQPDALTAEQKVAFTNLLDFVVNSTDEDFKAKLSDYYNLHSLGRWLIFVMVFHLTDEYNKNIMHATYDGKTFNAILYDLDTSFGLTWDGSGISDTITKETLVNMKNHSNLFGRFLHNFYPEVREQYWNARKTVLSNSNILNTWLKHYHEFPLLELERDNNKWNQPSVDFMNEGQILTFINTKLNFLDKEFKPETRSDL